MFLGFLILKFPIFIILKYPILKFPSRLNDRMKLLRESHVYSFESQLAFKVGSKQALPKNCPYLEFFWSGIFPHSKTVLFHKISAPGN